MQSNGPGINTIITYKALAVTRQDPVGAGWWQGTLLDGPWKLGHGLYHLTETFPHAKKMVRPKSPS
jgi:hypothetical protein